MSCTSTSQCAGGQVCVGGACGAAVILLAGSQANLLAGTFQIGAGWSTTTLSDTTIYGTSLTMDSSGRGVGVYTSSPSGVVKSTLWSSGAWGAPSPVTAGAIAMNRAAVDATGGAFAHVVYQDSTYHYWHAVYSGTWTTPQPVYSGGNQTFGPLPASVAAHGADATVGFIDGGSPSVNYAAQSDYTGGTWQTVVDIAGPESFTVPPAIIPLSAGPELMMVVMDQSASPKIYSLTRTAGTWTAPAYINNCLTNDPVALGALPNGGAILAFRGTDGYLYWTVYSGSAWSAVAPFATPNVSVDTTPAVTHGIGGHDAEIAYVAGGAAYHASLSGGAWSAPVMVGGSGLTGVAIAAAP